MEIVHEVNQLDFGGVEKVVRSIIKHDKKNKHKVLAYKDGPFKAKLEEVGAEVVVLTDENFDCAADVIHIHTGGAISNLGMHLAGQFPIVETIHSPVRSPMDPDIISQRVGVSDAVTKMNNKCITILNGLEYDELEPTKMPEEMRIELGITKPVVIGRLGRLGRDKGLEDWLLVCHILQKRGYDFSPLIVGGEARDCNGYRGKLKLLAECLPVKDIIWAGHRDDVANCLQVMDIFMYPSPTEGFGLVFAEAMNSGCAVATWKTPVTFELFGGYALLVDRKAGIIGMADKVEEILRSPEYMSELGGNGRSFVQGEYQAQKMSEEYQEVYERCHGLFNSESSAKEVDVVSR